MTAELNSASPPSLRRRKRIERELAVLRTMEGHLFTKEILWAILTIPGVAALVILVALKAHWWFGSPAIAATFAALTGLIVWWIGRHWLALASIIVFGLVLMLLEDLPDLGDIGDAGSGSAKEQRRVKLERAIARRQTLLAQMDGHRS